MAALGGAGAFATFVVFAWRDRPERTVAAKTISHADSQRRHARRALVRGDDQKISPVKYSGSPDHIGVGEAESAGQSGPAPKRIITGYGFWIFLLSDFVMFSGFYASYAVLTHATAGGPGPRDLFDLRTVGIETACLLLSSFTCGMATVASSARSMRWTQLAYLVTGILGVAFLGLELREFARMLGEGAGPDRSAFLSAFFTLVGCHGLHVTAGLLWLGTMMAQFYAKGFRQDIIRRGLCFGLFWHALDIIWVGIFTNVYLLGTSA
ncbi:MAG: cytochrome (ubi)quinol oxidase subunit III [Pseudolabrys sp.]|nr:cytochrome (ubi)quinol oxidase subunit III [Pseudolabrys sp.]